MPTEQIGLDGFESKYATWEGLEARPLQKDPETGVMISQVSYKETVEANISSLHQMLEEKKFISYEELTNLMTKVRSIYGPKDENEWKQFVTAMRRAYTDFDLTPRQKIEIMIDLINSVVSQGKHRKG